MRGGRRPPSSFGECACTHRNLRGGIFVLSAHRAAMADPALSFTDFLERLKDPRAADLVRGIRT